jgi:hypothetical protein
VNIFNELRRAEHQANLMLQREAGLNTSEFVILKMIGEYPGCRQMHIRDDADLHPDTIRQIVKRFSDRGWLQRSAFGLRLTQVGEDALANALLGALRAEQAARDMILSGVCRALAPLAEGKQPADPQNRAAA